VLILALDTTTRAGSAAVVRDGRVVVERAGDAAQTHGQRLPRELMLVLERAGAALADVELFAVAAGPGSFTGLRVGIATVQGLAMARDRLVVPVSVLDALARTARDGARRVAAWMDAQRGEVFAALYAADARALLIEPSSLPPEETLRSWQATGTLDSAETLFVGDGAMRYRDVIHRMLPSADVAPDSPPLAGIVGLIAAEQPSRAVLPHAVVPIYIRRSDAELARTKKQDRA
jgi:tRNA threonylcarbamoyladenosine biosynthesis protein TsaB